MENTNDEKNTNEEKKEIIVKSETNDSAQKKIDVEKMCGDIFHFFGKTFSWILNHIKTVLFLLVLIFAFSSGVIYKLIKKNIADYRNEPVTAKHIATLNYELNAEILESLNQAHKKAEKYVEQELDVWKEDVIIRTEDFLSNYFTYFAAKYREAKALFRYLTSWTGLTDSAEEGMINDIKAEVEKKVIVPELFELRMNNITEQAIKIYSDEIDEKFAKLQVKYDMQPLDWERYIKGASGMTASADSFRDNTGIKVFAGMTTYGSIKAGQKIVLPGLKKIFMKVNKKIAEKAATKAATTAVAKTAAKTGGKAASKLAAAVPYVGWIVCIGVEVWDIADYAATSGSEKEALRKNLSDYFDEIKKELLQDSERSIMGRIRDWENKIKYNINKA